MLPCSTHIARAKLMYWYTGKCETPTPTHSHKDISTRRETTCESYSISNCTLMCMPPPLPRHLHPLRLNSAFLSLPLVLYGTPNYAITYIQIFIPIFKYLDLGTNHLYLSSNHLYLASNHLYLGTNDLKIGINDLYIGSNYLYLSSKTTICT